MYSILTWAGLLVWTGEKESTCTIMNKQNGSYRITCFWAANKDVPQNKTNMSQMRQNSATPCWLSSPFPLLSSGKNSGVSWNSEYIHIQAYSWILPSPNSELLQCDWKNLHKINTKQFCPNHVTWHEKWSILSPPSALQKLSNYSKPRGKYV